MPLDALAPDQRAVVQLVLQRERTYGQIAELLKISEDAVRARAHAGLTALAPDVELPADKVAQIADFLLGQQDGKPRQATRRLLRGSNGARAWAETVRAQLEGVGGTLPDLPAAAAKRAGAEPGAKTAPGETADTQPEAEAKAGSQPDAAAGSEPEAGLPAPDAPSPRPRPMRDQAPRPTARPVAAGQGGPGAVAAASSRLGGAALIGLVVLALVALVLWLFVFRGDDGDNAPTSASASPTPTATAGQPNPVGQLELKGTGPARKAKGVLALYLEGQERLVFALQVQGMPATPKGQKYALWLSGPGNKAKWIGDVPAVGKNGVLQVQGPQEGDTTFTQDFAAHRRVLITRQTGSGRKQPGPTLVRGTLPRG